MFVFIAGFNSTLLDSACLENLILLFQDDLGLPVQSIVVSFTPEFWGIQKFNLIPLHDIICGSYIIEI